MVSDLPTAPASNGLKPVEPIAAPLSFAFLYRQRATGGPEPVRGTVNKEFKEYKEYENSIGRAALGLLELLVLLVLLGLLYFVLLYSLAGFFYFAL